MEKLRAFYHYLRKKYDLLSLKKYTTIAGTLVFFLIMSIIPLSFWMSLVIGKLPISVEEVLALPIFESVKEVFLYIQREAANATTGASVFLLITTLYSATNLFYQMRRSGEIVYDFHPKKKSWRLRLGSLALMWIVMLSVVVFLAVFALGGFLFSRFLSERWARFADYTLLATLAFLLALLLNTYVCPYKEKWRSFLPGTVITVVLWAGAVLIFSFYLKISNMSRLYGALSTVIVFLLWLYILMICFIIGVIFNSEEIVCKKNRKRKK